MARKLDNSDFDFDKDFALDDFGGFDEDFGGGKKSTHSRKEDIARSVFKGVGEGLTENLIESTLRRSLPKGYGEALDVAFVGKDSLESLYNTALKELKPGLDSAKRLTRQLMPKIDGSLPDSVANFMKEWSAPEDRDGAGERLSEDKQRDDLMAMEVGAIFQGQAEISKRTEERADARERIREGLAQVRHSQDIKLLSVIAQNVHRQAQYQDKILIRFQRKSLELQMRQYYATVDQLNVLRKGFQTTNQQLESIGRYSAMPDFEKTTISSKFKEITRNKFIEQARDSLFGSSTDFFKKFTENIGNQVKEQLSAFAMGLAMSADSASSALDMADAMGGEFDFTKEAATMVGRSVGGKALGKAQDMLGDRVKHIRGVAKKGSQLQYGARNMQHVTRRFLEKSGYENDFGEKSWGPLDIVRRFLLNAMPGNMPDLAVTTDKLGDMEQPGVINRQTIKTWNEIIPGMLARIHREIHVLRTGDEKAPLLAYDFSSNRFSTEKGVANSVLKGFLERGRGDVQNNLNNMLQTVGLGHLRGGPRKQIQEALLKHATERGDTNYETLGNQGTWKDLPPNLRKLVSSKFKSHLGRGANGEFADDEGAWSRVTKMDTSFKDLTKALSDPRAHIQQLINAGHLGALQTYGVVDTNGQINLALFRQYLLSNKMVGPDGEFINENLRKDGYAVGASSGTGYAQNAPRLNPADQTSADFGASHSAGLGADSGDVAEIRDILRQYPEKTDTIIALLGDLNKQLAAGIPTAAVTLADLEARVQKSKLNPMNWTIGDTVGKGVAGAKRLFKSLLNTSKRIGGLGQVLAGKAWVQGKKAITQIGDFLNDIWVKGEMKARLTKAKLLAGEYYDEKTGQVLKSWKDIKGRVKDKDGNIVLDLDELKNAWIGTKYGRALSSVVGKGIAFGTELFGQGRNFLTGAIGMAKNTAIDMWKKYRPPYDVYVKGTEGSGKPILTKAGFLAGLYYDKSSGSQIRHPAEIKGEVVEESDGRINILVNKEQLEQGLVDSNGVTVSPGLARFMGVAKGLLTRGLMTAQRIFARVAGTAGEFLRGVGGLLHDFFGGIFGARGEFLKNATLQTDTQLKILEVLMDRLPKRKKVVGDADGDGIRDGSFEDLRRRRQEMKDKADGQKTGGPQAGLFGGIGGIGAGLKGLYEKVMGRKKKDEDEDDGIGLDDVADGVSIASDVKDMKGAGKAGKTAGKAGRLGRMASGAKGIFGKGFGLAKSGLSKIGGLRTIGGLSSLLFGAGGTALRIGGGIAAGAAGALATGTVGVLGALAAGILGVVTSPIALTALGLTAAYYGYKYITKARLGVMSKARFAQYGFQDNDEEANIVVQPVFELEKKLDPAVNITKDGTASLDGSKFKMEELFEIFGISERDRLQASRFAAWFNDRFKPIFLAHVSAMRAKFTKATLASLDRETDKKALIAHLDATSMPGGPYNITESPFKEIKYLKVGSSGVQAAIDLAKSELTKDIKDDAEGSGLSRVVKTTAALGTALVKGDAAAAARVMENAYKPNKPADPLKAPASKETASAAFIKTDVRQLSALDAVKYRAYGLTTMDADKIIALRRLEGYLVPRIGWAGPTPSVEVDPYELAEAASVWFGFAGLNSPQGTRWMAWFEKRFRPVFLNYLGGLAAYTKKQNIEDALKILLPKDAVSIATALQGTMSTTGFRTSIWNVSDSPWKGYEVNLDSESTDGNIKALVKTSEAVLNEEHLRVGAAINKAAHDKKQSMKPGASGSAMTDAANQMIYMGYDPKKVAIQRQADGRGVQAAGDYIDGVKFNHNMVGGGGKVNELAQSKGDGWHNNKETIIGASQMVGVDPKLMANVIAIESGFRPNANAGGKNAAQGLGQFKSGTWNDVVGRHGSKYGIDPTAARTDARANALMTASYVKENIATLKSYLKREITATDLYLSHFLGPAGAKIFLTADPSAIGAEIRPDAAAGNPEIFYVNGDKSRPRTVAQIYQFLSERMKNRAADFGVRDSDFGGTATVSQARPLVSAKDGLKVVLMREPSADDGTFGKFVLPDGTSFESLELPWRENRPMTSSIPEGTYQCVIKTSPKFGEVYELKDVPGRAGVLIHAGNAAGDESKGLRSDVKGCIILGKVRMAEGTQRTVGQSRQAMREFNDKMGGRPFILTIRNAANQAGTAKQGTPKPDMATVQGQAQQAGNQNPAMVPGTAIPAAVVKSPIGAVPSIYSGATKSAPPSASASGGSTPTSSAPSTSPAIAAVARSRSTPSISTSPQASPDEQRAAQRQSDAMSAADVSSITRTLGEQLKVQIEMRNVMVQMLNQMSMKKEATPPAPAPTPGSSQGSFGSKRASDAPKPAVSMGR